MNTQHALAMVAASAPLFLGGAPPNACSLLTEAEVSTAIEAKSLAGTLLIPSSTAHCIWSDSPTHSVSSRRVTLDILRPGAYEFGKSMSGSGATIEPVKGIGDDAYYVVGKSDSPFLYARKGSTDFGVRILNGFKFKPFTLEQEKAKEADLAKAAAAKL